MSLLLGATTMLNSSPLRWDADTEFITIVTSPSSSQAIVSVGGDGLVRSFVSGVVGSWIKNPQPGIGNDWEVSATLISGLPPETNPLDTFLPLTETRVWGLQQIGIGERECRIRLNFRPAGGGAVVMRQEVYILARVT